MVKMIDETSGITLIVKSTITCISGQRGALNPLYSLNLYGGEMDAVSESFSHNLEP
jgi:hypothetical protein